MVLPLRTVLGTANFARPSCTAATLARTFSSYLRRAAVLVWRRPPIHATPRLPAYRKMDESLYPPRDKAARRLWDTMSKFKKGAGGRKQGRELLLPPESGYLRACAHQFAERLGLVHSSTGEGPARTVLLQLPSAATKREAAQGASSSTDAAPGADGEPTVTTSPWNGPTSLPG